MTITAWKLFTLRKDGTIGPLFVNRRQRIPTGLWIDAEAHHPGHLKFRPGWHCAHAKLAPHLVKYGRQWRRVKIMQFDVHKKPKCQGGLWYVAQRMYVFPYEKR